MINLSEILSAIPDPVYQSISSLINVSKIALIVLIVYFLIRIWQEIVSIRNAYNLKTIAENTSSINDKLSVIVKKKKKN